MGIKELPREAKWRERDKKTWFKGRVLKEVIIEEEYEFGDYSKRIQLIESDKGEKVIRFAYYVKSHGSDDSEYGYGSQQTLVVRQENARKLFDEANKRGFF